MSCRVDDGTCSMHECRHSPDAACSARCKRHSQNHQPHLALRTAHRCNAATAGQPADAEGDDEEPDEEDIAEGEEEDAAAEAEDDEVSGCFFLERWRAEKLLQKV